MLFLLSGWFSQHLQAGSPPEDSSSCWGPIRQDSHRETLEVTDCTYEAWLHHNVASAAASGAYFDQVLVLLGVPLQAQTSQQVLLSSLDQLVEDVEVPLPVVLVDHAGLFQQVVDDVASHRGALPTRRRPEGGRGGGGERGEDKARPLR